MTTHPCAYCHKPTAPELAEGDPWTWPSKGLVVACRLCTGTLAPARVIDTGEGVDLNGALLTVENVAIDGDTVTLDLVDDTDATVRSVTYGADDLVPMFHRSGW